MEQHPFDEYLEAQDRFREGNEEEAAESLARSLGAERPTTALRLAMRKIFERGNIVHWGFLDAIGNEARKRRSASD